MLDLFLEACRRNMNMLLRLNTVNQAGGGNRGHSWGRGGGGGRGAYAGMLGCISAHSCGRPRCCSLPASCLSVCPLRLSERKHTDSLNLSNNSRRPPQVPLAARFATYA